MEFTGFTLEGYEINEWQDTTVSPEQHQVYMGYRYVSCHQPQSN